MIQYELARQLRGTYPYQLFTPWERGVQGAIDVLSDKIGIDDEFLEERTSKVVRDLAQSHYQLNNSFVWNLLAKMVPEDLTMRLLQRVFGVNHFMGAGLLFLSRYPIDTMQSRFEAYEAKADLERFATKGVLKTVVTGNLPPHAPPGRDLKKIGRCPRGTVEDNATNHRPLRLPRDRDGGF